jgi:hypothetical protein
MSNHVQYPELVEKLESIKHCEHCPTLHGERRDCDPEQEEVRNNLEMLEAYGSDLYCPWKRCSCPCYKVAWKYHHDRLTEAEAQ